MDDSNISDSGEQLAEWEIEDIISRLESGGATNGEARLLLDSMLSELERNERLSSALREYLRRSLAAFLKDGTSLEVAFGLTRGRAGRPPNDSMSDVLIAVEILRERLTGKTLEAALESAVNRPGEELPIGVRQARTLWGKHMEEAYTVLRIEYYEDEKGWTRDEINKLHKIFGKRAWFRAPKNSGD